MNPLNMTFSRSWLLLLCLLGAGVASAAAPQPRAEGWSRWEVDLQAGASAPCCWEVDGDGQSRQRGCRLDEAGGDTVVQHLPSRDPAGRLRVFVLQRKGEPVSLRTFGSDCPIATGADVQVLDGVDTAASVAWLSARLPSGQRSLAESALVALAFHAGADATAVLAAAAGSDQPRARREQSLFWLGQTRGIEGLPTLLKAAAGDGSIRIRQHVLFVLSQSPLPEARQALRDRTRQDVSAKVRGQGLFWLAQVGDEQAEPLTLALIADSAQASAHDQALFALSQLPDGRGDDALIGIVEGDYPRGAKKQALFWLGQSGSDKALRFLDRLLASAG